MSQNKTQPTKSNVTAFLEAVSSPQKREDCRTLATLMQEITCEKPVLWGKSIVGFGSYNYRYASGRKGTWFLSGFFREKMPLHSIYFVIWIIQR